MSIRELLGPEDAIAFTHNLLVALGESTPDLIYAKDLHSRMLFANRAVLTVLGKSWDDIRGKSDDEWHHDPDEGRRFVEADARVMATGETESVEETLTGVDGTHIYLSTKTPMRGEKGDVIGLFGISKNITALKKEERFRQILLNELDHRVRNTLAIVQVMARQTFKQASIDKSVWAAFDGRLVSMTQAHRVLTQRSWSGADIREIVREGLQAHGGADAKCFAISGPEAWIDSQTALALAMILHELGTNAVKYGALSHPQGLVTISWREDTDEKVPMLDFHWKESGGPTVVQPERKGFGSRLIEQAFRNAGGNLSGIKYRPEGVEFHGRFNVGERTEE